MKKLLLLAMPIVCSIPVAVWFFYKPARVLAPQWLEGITCSAPNICIDDRAKLPEAMTLYANALQAVSQTVGDFKEPPHTIFCSTHDCFKTFGFDQASAKTVGKWGIVIGPNGWKDHYIRHEMIHHRQAEELGVMGVIFSAQWFIEGMAYALSNDPRALLSEPWQGYRSRFERWFAERPKEDLWKDAPLIRRKRP
ncbi:MAG: hypothetical protein JXK05_07195 [Campylobacterales bacterium]|nr:hypothetical protein [Campylobacterales bacterium]